MRDFYVVAYESGAAHTPVAVWATEIENPLGLECDCKRAIQRIDIESVPGAFQLLNVLTQKECENLIKKTEQLGYEEDAAISLPRSVRHNENLVWVVDELTHDIIYHRCEAFLYDRENIYAGKKPLALNRRWRFYKYAQGDFFKAHTDGSWPGSAVVDKKLLVNAYDRYSQMTFLIFLSDDFSGGATQFFVDKDDPTRPATSMKDAKLVDIKTAVGGVLCFPHGTHPLHCLHSSQEIRSGTKYIIRTDVLF